MTSFPVDSSIGGCWKNYKMEILNFQIKKNFEICTYRVHVTSSTKYPIFQFLISKILENQRAWKWKISPRLILVRWTRWAQPIFAIRNFLTFPHKSFWVPMKYQAIICLITNWWWRSSHSKWNVRDDRWCLPPVTHFNIFPLSYPLHMF